MLLIIRQHQVFLRIAIKPVKNLRLKLQINLIRQITVTVGE